VIEGPIKKALNEDGFLDMVDLTLLPYGNARVQDDKVVCQHGPNECYGNKIEACGLDHASTTMDGAQFVACVDVLTQGKTADDFDNLTEKCAAASKLDAGKVKSCAKGSEGDSLIQKIAKQTPTHQYVP
jgi:interferon gamma-inducible protein 30